MTCKTTIFYYSFAIDFHRAEAVGSIDESILAKTGVAGAVLSSPILANKKL